jgi:hypothetical protein
VTEEHWAAIERHFDALFERSPAERSAGLAAIADEQIRCEVASLLQHSGSGGSLTRRRIHSHIVLGRLLWRTGRFEQATKQFNVALGLAERSAKANPTDIAVQFDLSDCYRAFCQAGIAGTFRQRDVTLWRTWNRTQHPYRYSLERESEAAHVAALRW